MSKLKTYHSNDLKTVLSVHSDSKNCEIMPKELFISMAEPLDLDVPVQVQFEIQPKATLAYTTDETGGPLHLGTPGVYVYLAQINSVKARVKPGSTEFSLAESKKLSHLIEGTEEQNEEKERHQRRIQKFAKPDSLSRFSGLDLT